MKKTVKNRKLILLAIPLVLIVTIDSRWYVQTGGPPRSLSFMFYNTENLFDTIDSDLDDDEFLPSSDRRWNTRKYYTKLNNTFKVIALAGEDMKMPDIIGLCEVENSFVLDDLCSKTGLSREGYDYIISQGKDSRGINTALLYRRNILEMVSYSSWLPVYADGSCIETRAVLHSRLKAGDDTLDVLICHWPSRRGGVIESDNRRKAVAAFMKQKIDSLGPGRKLVIMGDFNDEPGSESVNTVLGAAGPDDDHMGIQLINASVQRGESKGSYKYQGTWYMFDQFILSASLYHSERGLYYVAASFSILDDNALLTDDPAYRGKRPESTWWGYRYRGGYSDHLPVTIRLGYR